MTALTHIYIEDHPVVPIGTFEETDKRAKDDSIRKGYESKQSSAEDSSHSVFVTNKSRIYHKSSCPELGTGNLLVFDSPQKALEEGGVPCVHCNP